MLRLPDPRTSTLTAFWLSACALTCATVGLALGVLHGRHLVVSLGAAALLFALAARAGLRRRALHLRLYRAWDGAAGVMESLAERIVSATLADLIQAMGAHLGLARPPLAHGRERLAGYRRWALRARSPWAMALVPGLSLLSAIDRRAAPLRSARRGGKLRKVTP